MSANGQTLTGYRGEDLSIVLTGEDDTDPAAWALSFQVTTYPGQAVVRTVTAITVGGSGPYTLTVPLTRAQTSELTDARYAWDVWRTDAGGAVRLAGGWLLMNTPVYPPA